MTYNHHKRLLYAEDDVEDQQLFIETMSAIDPSIDVEVFENGIALLERLNEPGADTDLPCCIVLDLNMPLLDGKHTLKELKQNARFRSVPVCIFTTSSDASEEHVCKKLQADRFYLKPFNMDEMITIAKEFSTICKHRAAC